MQPIRTTEREMWFPAADAVIRGISSIPHGPPIGGVVLVPDVRGVSPLYRSVARRLAAEGFAVLTLDIYSREGTPDLPDMAAVMRCIQALPDERVLADVAEAARHLTALPDMRGRRVGVLGFCLGGQYALMAACRDTSLTACVSFYGMLRYDEHPHHKPASPLELAANLACPMLGLYGADDPLIPASDRLELEAILAKERKDFSLHVFGRAGHAFMNESRPADYRPESTAVAWRLALEFLRTRLGG
jgi:carboxymethylenebutenolidase